MSGARARIFASPGSDFETGCTCTLSSTMVMNATGVMLIPPPVPAPEPDLFSFPAPPAANPTDIFETGIRVTFPDWIG